MENLLSATFDLVHDFNNAMTVDDVYAVMLCRLEPYGVTSVLAGIIPRSIVKPSDQPRYVVFGRWPDEWATRYFKSQYVRRDPTILHAAEETAPLYWSELAIDKPEYPASRIMNEAGEFGLKDGVTIPQLTLDGTRIGVSFAGERIDKSPMARTIYSVVASYAVARVIQIRVGAPSGAVGLTPAQGACLQYAAAGRTITQIGDRLGISEKTVEKHLSAARERLQAFNTTQAVATAMRLGFLS